MRLLCPSCRLFSSRQVSKQSNIKNFFKLLLQAGERPQQQLEGFRRTPGFNYKIDLMNATQLTRWAVCLFAFLVAGCLGVAQTALAGDIPESQRTTGDVVLVENIEVFNESPNTVRLQLPTDVAPVSPVPLFIPANNPNAHVFATMVLPETILDPTTPPTGREVAWWDVLIKVTAATTGALNEDVMISIDKDVLNNTRFHWADFHMELGRGIGAAFERSGEFDFLFFKDEPPPISSDGKFMNPPSQDDAAAPDVLWWDWKPPVNPGVKPGELARFWLGINVPRELFVDGMATFTLRQHATIPEPTTVVLLLAGFVFLALAVASLEGMVRQLGFGPGATHMVFVLSLSLGLVALLWIAFGRFLAFARRRHLAAALIVAPVIALMSGAVAGLVIGYMVQLLGTPESSRASVHLIAFGAGVLLSIVHMVRKLRSAKESVRTETVVAARPT